MQAPESFKSEPGLRFSCRLPLAVLVVLTAVPLLADVASIRSLIRNGRFTEAVAACDRELKAAPGNAPLLTLKGIALASAGDRAAALAALRIAQSVNPNYLPALEAAAQIEFDGQDANAVRTLESILRLSPTNQTAHAMLGSLLFQRQSCGRAVAHFERVSQRTPSLRWQYGVCLLEVERWSDAATQFAALLHLREHAPTRYNLGLSLWNAKNFKEAVTVLSPLEAQGDDDAIRLLASAFESLGETPKALSILQKALQSNPSAEPLLLDLAVLCMDHNSLDLAEEVIQAGINRLPASARLHTLLGVLRVRQGNVDAAKTAFLRAQELAPETGLGRIGIASALMQLGLSADAVNVLREQIAFNGRDPKTDLTLARALLMNSPSPVENREAVTLLEQVAKNEPANVTARVLLGKAYLQLGDSTRAAVALTEAVRLDPSDRTSTYLLMKIQQRAGRTKEAAELARKVNSLVAMQGADNSTGDRFKAVRSEEVPTVR
jgi:Flp pilus assembly protein TadD